MVARSALAHSTGHKIRNPTEVDDVCFQIRDTALPIIPGRPSKRPPVSPSPHLNGHVLATTPDAPGTLKPPLLRLLRSRRLQIRSRKAPPIDRWQRFENRSRKQPQSTLPSVPIHQQLVAFRSACDTNSPRDGLSGQVRKYGLSEQV